MEKTLQKYFAKIDGFNEAEKYVDIIVLHYDVPNHNDWMPVSGCLDDDIAELKANDMHVPAMYNHNGNTVMIGRCTDFKEIDKKLIARIYLDNIPFVNETVIPQLKSKTIQGSSPTIQANVARHNVNDKNIIDVLKGKLAEISLVGRPADTNAKILNLKASLSLQIEAKEKENFEFELLTL